MKREDLEKMGLTKEQIDAIMAENGKDVEKVKTDVQTAKTEADTAKAQLAEANKAIEGFKGLDVEGIKKAADDYKALAEQAKKDADARVAALQFDHALDKALGEAKVKDTVSVRAHLKADALKLNEDGSILGLKEQLDSIKSTKDFLFESESGTPKIVAGGKNNSVMSDAVVEAARIAAGLKPAGENK
jgi:hypothetical protein